jgi:hypothetical protein
VRWLDAPSRLLTSRLPRQFLQRGPFWVNLRHRRELSTGQLHRQQQTCFLGAMKFVASQGGPKVPADATVIARSASGRGRLRARGGAHHHTAGCRQGGSTGARGEGAPSLPVLQRHPQQHLHKACRGSPKIGIDGPFIIRAWLSGLQRRGSHDFKALASLASACIVPWMTKAETIGPGPWPRRLERRAQRRRSRTRLGEDLHGIYARLRSHA